MCYNTFVAKFLHCIGGIFMNIEILTSLEHVTKNRYQLIIGTHNGIFHPDEMFATAFFCLFHSNNHILILRTREANLLKQCNICVDIGGGRYDHHQLGFNETRQNGIKYASAGLVWRDYGKQLITLIFKHYFPTIKCDNKLIDSIFKTFDEKFVVPIDLEDNGKQKDKHSFSFITSFLPLYFNTNTENFNRQFYKALIATIEVLELKLMEMISQYPSNDTFKTKLSIKTEFSILFQNFKSKIGKKFSPLVILSRYFSNDYFNNGILCIPSQTLEWKESVIQINSSRNFRKINFVIFEYPDGGWAAQCVPPSLENEFGQRISFPLEWAGQNDYLPIISGVEGAILCTSGRFFARAKDKQSIIKMCIIATCKSHSI